MKNKILQIMYKLSKREIKYNLAAKQVLDLLDVSGSFTASDMEHAYNDGYSTEGEINFDIENYH